MDMSISNVNLSIIVPIYNTKEYLPECLASIINQKHREWECILVDDGSTDGSAEICDEYAAGDERIRVIHQENQGATMARLAGIKASLATFIGFVDSDDWIESDMFERLLQPMLQSDDIDVSMCGFISEYADHRYKLMTTETPLLLDREKAVCFMFGNRFTTWSLSGKVYRRELFLLPGLLAGWEKVSFGEDTVANWRILRHIRKALYIPLLGYHYRIHPKSMMRRGSTEEKIVYIDIHLTMLDEAVQEGRSRELIHVLIDCILYSEDMDTLGHMARNPSRYAKCIEDYVQRLFAHIRRSGYRLTLQRQRMLEFLLAGEAVWKKNNLWHVKQLPRRHLTSIVIVSHNSITYTKLCIESIREHTTSDTYEVIVVDNASEDESLVWLKAQGDVKLIENRQNVGFAAACNQGLAVSAGDSLLLLNSDTVVTEHWLTNLLSALYSDSSVGAVSCVSNSADGQSIRVPYGADLAAMQRFAETFNAKAPGFWQERSRLIGFCLLFKRQVYIRVGGLDEQFFPSNYEDDDYCLRIMSSGYRLLLCYDTFIHHFGGVSFRKSPLVKSTPKGVSLQDRSLEINKQKFFSKWQLPENYMEMAPEFVLKAIKGKHDMASQEPAELGVIISISRTGSTIVACLRCLKAAMETCHIDGRTEIVIAVPGTAGEELRQLAEDHSILLYECPAAVNIASLYNYGSAFLQSQVGGVREILFMHDGIILGRYALKHLRQALEMRLDIGAVGADAQDFTGRSLDLQSFYEMEASRSGNGVVANFAFFLDASCMLVKAEAMEDWDECCSAEDNRILGGDLGIRLLKKHYKLLQVQTAVQHLWNCGCHVDGMAGQSKNFFKQKWGVDDTYSFFIRNEVLNLLDVVQGNLCVLDVGCAAGGNLMYLQATHPFYELHGIELDEAAAGIADNFAAIDAVDVEQYDKPEWQGKFDCIIAADIIEHLRNPWTAVRNFHAWLKPSGQLLLSLPNVLHVTEVMNLLKGRFDYQDSGILDRTHLRFFTGQTGRELLEEAGFMVEKMLGKTVPLTTQEQDFIDRQATIDERSNISKEIQVYQWIISARKPLEN